MISLRGTIKVSKLTGSVNLTPSSDSQIVIRPVEITPTAEGFVMNAADANCSAYNPITVLGDRNLIPENVADGVTIFGVKGSHVGGDGTFGTAKGVMTLALRTVKINNTQVFVPRKTGYVVDEYLGEVGG